MSTWSDIVGEFKSIQTNKTLKTISECMYWTMLKHREQLLKAHKSYDSNFVDPHNSFMSFTEENEYINDERKASEKERPKYTKTVKRKTGETETVEANKVKWFNIGQRMKWGMRYILMKYLKEIQDFYDSNDKQFPDESVLIEKLMAYNADKQGIISTYILELTDNINPDKFVDSIYGKLDEFLLKVVGENFKNSEGVAPSMHLNVFVHKFIKFVKMVSLAIATQNWEGAPKRQGNDVMLRNIMRALALTTNDPELLEPRTLHTMEEYIEEQQKLVEQAKTKNTSKSSVKSDSGSAEKNIKKPAQKDKQTKKSKQTEKSKETEKPKKSNAAENLEKELNDDESDSDEFNF